MRSIEKVTHMLDELEASIVNKDLISETVSKASIGWHLEHSLLVINSIVEATKNSEPAEFNKKFNFAKFYVFSLGRIPLKKGRAPKAVTPKTPASVQELEKLLNDARTGVNELTELTSDRYFKHPIFGDLRLNDTIRFLELHTEHHSKIMRAIKSANTVST